MIAAAALAVLLAVPAQADWLLDFAKRQALDTLVRMAKDQLIIHLQNRSTTAISKVRHDEPRCEDRRRDFDAILPLAAEVAFLARTAYDTPAAIPPAGAGLPSHIRLGVPHADPSGAFASVHRLSLQGNYRPPPGFPAPAGWGQDPGTAYPVVVITYRGTEPLSPADWFTNIYQGFGGTPPQYHFAMRFAESVLAHVARDELVVFTGHSLGGSLATMAALRSNKGAITLNAAGLHPNNLQLAVGNIAGLKTSDIANVYHFLAHSADGLTDIVGNISFAGYSILAGAKYFVNIPGVEIGRRPDLGKYVRLHDVALLWEQMARLARSGGGAPLSCVELHGRAIYMHP